MPASARRRPLSTFLAFQHFERHVAAQVRPMTADEFELAYAARSGLSVERLRTFRTVRPCHCGDESCEGWQSISHERARDYDTALPHERHLV